MLVQMLNIGAVQGMTVHTDKQACYLLCHYYNSSSETGPSGWYRLELREADCDYGFSVRSVAE